MRNPSFPPFRVGLFLCECFPDIVWWLGLYGFFLAQTCARRYRNACLQRAALPRVRLHFFHARVRRELVICVWLPVTKLIPPFFFLRPPSCFYLTGFAHDPVAKKVHTQHTHEKRRKHFSESGGFREWKGEGGGWRRDLGRRTSFVYVYLKKKKKETHAHLFSRCTSVELCTQERTPNFVIPKTIFHNDSCSRLLFFFFLSVPFSFCSACFFCFVLFV